MRGRDVIRACTLFVSLILTCCEASRLDQSPAYVDRGIDQRGSHLDDRVHWVELGRHLFYERRLSLNEDRSCGICHEQAKGFTDGFVRAVGTTGDIHPRNTPTLLNVSRRAKLGWVNQDTLSLEEQVLIPLLGDMPIEMGAQTILSDRLEIINSDPIYASLMNSLGVSQLTLTEISYAIARFEETLVSDQAPYDRYISGKNDAITASARRGLELFNTSLPCRHCHGGTDFDQPDLIALSAAESDGSHSESGRSQPRHAWFNTGLYHLDDGRYPNNREGLYHITGRAEDIGKYRIPTLRHLGLTAPYYHDGSRATLHDVLKDYNRGGRITRSGPYMGDGSLHPNKHPLLSPLGLSDQELIDLEAFLRSLTDMSIIHVETLSDPWSRD